MLIFTLAASLVVAFIMNPVFAVDFMNHPEGDKKHKSAIFRKPFFITVIIAAIVLYLSVLLPDALGLTIIITDTGGTLNIFFANLLIFAAVLMIFNAYVLDDAIHNFQNRVLPGIMNRYEKLLRWSLKG
ncbi:MAG TPA: hypothetical protein VLR49_03740, partial [Ferruginibacter sp.]|nr:hypothetical protein [Ferruginibacter sp.]